jgi:4-hydroxybenzoate polyprenyltransferase
MHVLMLAMLAGIGIAAGLGWLYFAGVGIVGALIAYEHTIVSPDDLRRVNVAFFTMNGWVGVTLFAFVLLDRVL